MADEKSASPIRRLASTLLRRIRGGVDFDSFRAIVRPEPASDLEEIIYSGECRRVHKWIHYPAIYERLFADYRGTDVRFLEIGVFGGGSLDMWRRYLGQRAIIHGIDIDPACAALNTNETPVHIGSQDDRAFLQSVVNQMGGLEVVLDDGSHVGKHQRKSFNSLWPLLSEGGLYVIEDVHTSYWPEYEGGHGRRGTAISLVKEMIDDMHGWYHNCGTATPAKTEIGSLHIFDSIIAIEKKKRERPSHLIT